MACRRQVRLKEGLARCDDREPISAEVLIPELGVCNALKDAALPFNHGTGCGISRSRVEQYAVNTKTACFQYGYAESQVTVATTARGWRNVVADMAATLTKERSIDSVA